MQDWYAKVVQTSTGTVLIGFLPFLQVSLQCYSLQLQRPYTSCDLTKYLRICEEILKVPFDTSHGLRQVKSE